jgi:hypothetical protein
MAEQIGTYHLSDNPQLYEIQRANCFEFLIHDAESLLQAGVDETDADETDYLTGNQETVRLSVVSFDVPHFSQEEIEIRRGNSRMYAAGVPSFDAGTLEVNDYIGAGTKSVLLAWQRLSYDVTSEKVGRMGDWTDASGVVHQGYKKNCELIEYTPDFTQVVRTWDLVGCWVRELREGKYDMNDGGKKIVSATIRFDRAIPHLPQEAQD